MERKHQHLSLIASSVLLLVLVLLAFWQTSLDFGEFRPSGSAETVVLWAISTLVVLGVLTLGFIVFRSLLKLYIERRQNRPGSKIKTKLVAGALVLSIVPVACMVLFSFTFLNRTLDKWFNHPTEEILTNAEEVMSRLNDLMREKTETDATWMASLPEVAAAFEGSSVPDAAGDRLRELAGRVNASYVGLLPPGAREPLLEVRTGDLIRGPVEWRLGAQPPDSGAGEQVVSGVDHEFVWASAPVGAEAGDLGRVVVAWRIPQDLLDRQDKMQQLSGNYLALSGGYRSFRYFYSGIIALITLFVLFVATWVALFLSKQIIVPIEALVEATGALSTGHLDHRVQTPAIDELAALVQSFNHMTQQLESKTRLLEESNQELALANVELEARRRFINALLDSITPGVVSASDHGVILKANSSLSQIFPAGKVQAAERLQELFSPEDYEEIRYMMKRARRIGLATREFEIKRAGQILHLAVTVSALEREGEDRGAEPPTFVVVLEDTTELLRAQKSAAWNEVARRVAHEIKNPLTPIALSAERMSRLLDRLGAAGDAAEQRQLEQRFRQCTSTIVREVESLRTLVNEFAQFARFPAAQPVRADLNQVVEAALDVFDGRLDGITLRRDLAVHLPPVYVDPDQFKRAVVNLIDNAAEALQDCWVKEIFIATSVGALPETVELTIADSGQGISAEDKEKLFLPYFSTKRRGTGLGLAIVNRILTEHHAAVRVEDNRPSGCRFIVEIPTADSGAAVVAEARA